MRSKPHDPADTELASDFTVRDYEKARDNHPPDRDAIAEAIRRRFTERYIKPVLANPRHGFTMMAVSCLMIEALECFRQGWKTSKGQSEKAFLCFFNTSEPFKEFREYAKDFYSHVRCGILHQAETRGGWRILRGKSPLFDANQLTVNAESFLAALEQVLSDYCDQLKAADWDGSEWEKARFRMSAYSGPLRQDNNASSLRG